MDNNEITQSDITKLLSGLKADEAPEPDELPDLLHKNAANEIIISFFERYLATSMV